MFGSEKGLNAYPQQNKTSTDPLHHNECEWKSEVIWSLQLVWCRIFQLNNDQIQKINDISL